MADGKKDCDILTIRIHIKDREKIRWLWDGMGMNRKDAKHEEFIEKHGMDVVMLGWGDSCSEKEYVLDRVKRYLDRYDRQELFEEMGIDRDPFYGELEDLEEFIEVWEKEAWKRYGMDTTAEEILAIYKKEREERKAKKALEDAELQASKTSSPAGSGS